MMSIDQVGGDRSQHGHSEMDATAARVQRAITSSFVTLEQYAGAVEAFCRAARPFIEELNRSWLLIRRAYLVALLSYVMPVAWARAIADRWPEKLLPTPPVSWRLRIRAMLEKEVL